MPHQAKQVVNGGVNIQKALYLMHRLEPKHPPLSLFHPFSGRPYNILPKFSCESVMLLQIY